MVLGCALCHGSFGVICMRRLLCVFGFLLGFLGTTTQGQLQLGVADAQAFNPLKYCVDNCVQSGSQSIGKCKKNECSGLKSKSKLRKCERRCDKPGGLLKYCDTTCKTSQVCTRGLEMKACMKEKCDPYKKSNIHRYIKCKKVECGSICKN